MGEYALDMPFIAVSILSQLPTYDIRDKRILECLEMYRSLIDRYPLANDEEKRKDLMIGIERQGNHILYLVNKALKVPSGSTLVDLLGSTLL